MRALTLILGLSLIFVSNFSRADVVITNTSGTAGTNSNASNFETSFNINFSLTSGSAVSIQKITLYNDTASFSDTVSFSVFNGVDSYSENVSSSSIGGGGYDFSFSSNILNAVLGQGSWTFSVSNLNDGYKTFTNLTDNPTITTFGTSIGFNTPFGISNINNTTNTAKLELYAVAVPEPGTMALGAIALASGGVGTWWRRKRKAEANCEASE